MIIRKVIAGFSLSAFQYDLTEASSLPKITLRSINHFIIEIFKPDSIFYHGPILRS